VKNKTLGSALIGVVILSVSTACSKQEQQTENPAVSNVSASQAFQVLLDDHWNAAVAEKIYFRSDPDAWRMDGTLSEHTIEARERRRLFNEGMLERLAEIDESQLAAAERVSLQVFRYERETERDSYAQYDHRFPFTSLFGYHTYFAEAPSNMAFLSADDYDQYLISLGDFPRYNREHIALHQEAVGTGYTHYCESMAGYQRTISTHIVDDPTDSLLFVPFSQYPAVFSEEQKASYSSKGESLIQEKVVPGYRELLDYFESEYMPKCRQEVGITAVPGGDKYYQYLIRYFTTTNMTPKQIHDLGLSEVARIRAEMQAIIEQLQFSGDFKAFLEYLRAEPAFYAKTETELLGRAALISKTAEGALPRFFGLLPRGTYKISPNPNRGTFYMPSSGDGTTSGTYFLSTGDLASEPLYSLESLTLHEGVPGHHLQTALAMELDLPEFRRTLYHSAYGEGWGLYSERLGKEMGFYQDPYSDFGRLTYEAWRACRLVVDTGMHAFGWSRQKAIDYMLDNTAASVLEATREIDRYITWPAQALSYKIGELKIRELRTRAETELGSSFDIRSFHDTVIGNGSLPIAVLEELVSEWIDEAKSGKGATNDT
jgi:uncharacterized protein (DUF885 family)